MSGELPVWVKGECIRVRGVGKKTTCKEVIAAVVGGHQGSYVLVERWGGVEKILGESVKVLDLWSQWGEARNQVRLTVKTKHSRSSRGKRIERLLKLVLAQGETIRHCLQELHHPVRVSAIPLREEIKLWEKIIELNEKLEKQEEALVKLYVNLFKYSDGNEAIVLEELQRVRMESEEFARQLDFNDHNLLETEFRLNRRKNYLMELHMQLEATDVETNRLLQLTECVLTSKEGQTSDVDSNSDTGLSSLHSSSEEGTYVLDAIL